MMKFTTNNESYGFFGTIAQAAFIRKAQESAFNAVAEEIKNLGLLPEDKIVDFLDSRMGRHLADSLVNVESEDELVIRMTDIIRDYINRYRNSK